MKELKGTEDFLRINQNVNIFDIISCKEEQASQIIAWLLNPRDAHGFGNKFFEAMLNTASKTSQLSGYKYSNKKVEISRKSKQTLLNSYNEVIIQTEYCIDKECKNKKEGRVDILLCLEDAQTLFVIENKYGSQEHSKQAKKYFKHFSKANYKDYTIFYFYLDINACYENDKFKFSDDMDHWYFLDYEWIVNFLKKNKSAECVSKIIQDIIIEFEGDHKNEKYFDPFYKKAKSLFNTYKEDVQSYKDPFPYSPVASTENDKKYALYNDFYNCLSQYSQWDNLIDNLNEKIYSAESHRANDMAVTLKTVSDKYNKLYKNKNTRKKWWPFYINIRLCYVDNEETEDQRQDLEVKLICTNEYIINKSKIQKGLKDLFENRKESYQKYVMNNIDNIQLRKSNEKISVFYLRKNMIENFDFSASKNKKLYGIIDEYSNDLKKMYEIFFS